MPAQVIQHKRGKTWRETAFVTDAAGALVDLTGWVVTSKLRRTAENDVVVQTFTCTVHADQVGHKGEFEVFAPSASSLTWPLSTLVWDIRIQALAGDIEITETVVVQVSEAVTR